MRHFNLESLGARRQSSRDTAVLEEVLSISSVPLSSLSLVVVVGTIDCITDSLAMLVLASTMIQPWAHVAHELRNTVLDTDWLCLEYSKIVLSIFFAGLAVSRHIQLNYKRCALIMHLLNSHYIRLLPLDGTWIHNKLLMIVSVISCVNSYFMLRLWLICCLHALRLCTSCIYMTFVISSGYILAQSVQNVPFGDYLSRQKKDLSLTNLGAS